MGFGDCTYVTQVLNLCIASTIVHYLYGKIPVSIVCCDGRLVLKGLSTAAGERLYLRSLFLLSSRGAGSVWNATFGGQSGILLVSEHRDQEPVEPTGSRGYIATTMSAEALRLQLENLQWEANCLDAENRRLRDERPAASALVDLESELERAREDTATSMQRTRKLEDLLTGKEAEISEATHGAVATEERLQKCE